jgi:thymidylate synthase
MKRQPTEWERFPSYSLDNISKIYEKLKKLNGKRRIQLNKWTNEQFPKIQIANK